MLCRRLYFVLTADLYFPHAHLVICLPTILLLAGKCGNVRGDNGSNHLVHVGAENIGAKNSYKTMLFSVNGDIRHFSCLYHSWLAKLLFILKKVMNGSTMGKFRKVGQKSDP